eukprot:gene9736-20249_t
MEREPCPWRIVDDAGGAFAFGLVGGGIWNAVGGARNAPKGLVFQNALNRCKARAPILGGSFAVWGTFFSIFDCSLASIRKREDPWNAILSGAATGGILALRAGLKSAGKSAVVGGLVLAAIEGLNIAVQRVLLPYIEKSQTTQHHIIDMLDPPTDILSAKSLNKQTIWDTATIKDYAPPPPAAGFDIDAISQFDSTSSSWENKPKDEEKPVNPWWKPW